MVCPQHKQKQKCDRKRSGRRPSEAARRPFAGGPGAHPRVPRSGSFVEKAPQAFYEEPESRLWHEAPLSCPVPMTSRGGVDAPGPSPVPAISASHSGFLLIWGQSLFLVFSV